MAVKKVLCCADLHLGRSSSGIAFPSGVDISASGAWTRIVNAAISGEAHIVAIAGDVFDGMGSYNQSQIDFRGGLEMLTQAGIDTVAVSGNHDHEALRRFSKTTDGLRFTVLGLPGKWESKVINEIRFLGWSFTTQHQKEPALKSFASETYSGPTVGLLHGETDKPESFYNYIDTNELVRHADAWVLGHIHKPRWFDTKNIVYPGSPQAFDFGPGEREEHGFYWLEVDSKIAKFSSLVPTSSVRFDHLSGVRLIEEGEDPFEVLERWAEQHCESLRKSQANLQSVQLRITAELVGAAQVPTPLPGSSSGRHGFEFISIAAYPRHDLWAETESTGPSAELSRLLIAARAYNGVHEGRTVDAEWIRSFERICAKVQSDVERLWRNSIDRVKCDYDEHSLAERTPEEFAKQARQTLLVQLEAKWQELNRNSAEAS